MHCFLIIKLLSTELVMTENVDMQMSLDKTCDKTCG